MRKLICWQKELLELYKRRKYVHNEKNIFKWDVLRHLKDFAETYQKEIQQYRTIGTVEECRAAVEMQTAIPRELIEGKYFCPKCHNLMPYPGYCGCGQKVY